MFFAWPIQKAISDDGAIGKFGRFRLLDHFVSGNVAFNRRRVFWTFSLGEDGAKIPSADLFYSPFNPRGRMGNLFLHRRLRII